MLIDFLTLSQQCAPTIAPQTMASIVKVESGHNPYAIGVVGGKLERQPKSLPEAIATVENLEKQGWNFSMGMSQVNKQHLSKFGLTYEQLFDPCANLNIGAKILEDCFTRARQTMPEQAALQAAFSCYYSGNFTRGFKPDSPHQKSYVQKVLAASEDPKNTIETLKVPALAIPVISATKPPETVKTAPSTQTPKTEARTEQNKPINDKPEPDTTDVYQQTDGNQSPSTDVYSNQSQSQQSNSRVF